MRTKRKLKQTRKQAKREPGPDMRTEILRWAFRNAEKNLSWFACDAREFAWKQMKLAAAQRRGNIHGRM